MHSPLLLVARREAPAWTARNADAAHRIASPVNMANMDQDQLLLSNVFEALDRLYDRTTKAVDVQALTFATSVAVESPEVGGDAPLHGGCSR